MLEDYTYMRKFIVLDNKYTNIKDIHPKGHGKIEVRGTNANISLNLENAQMERDYKVYFLKDINGNIEKQDMGRIIADEKGRFRGNMDLDLYKLESEGFFIKEIDAILIKKGIDILMAGYIDEDNGTIEKFIKQTISKQEKIIEEVREVEEVEEIKEVEEVAETKEPEEIKEEVEEVEQTEEIQQVEEVEEVDEKKDEEAEEIEEPNEQLDYQSLEHMRQLNHKNQMTDYILNILKFFPFVQPLNNDLSGYSWWLIEDDGTDAYKGFLPYYNYLTGSEYKHDYLDGTTGCLDLIKKYEHYLFGLYKENDEIKYYLYGVPGEFSSGEHPFRGDTGFNTWYESNNIGYWILYIDPMSGKIVRLLNPMIPAY